MERLTSLINILRGKRGYSKKELMERLEYGSDKTFSRDLELLRERFSVEISYNASKNVYTCTDTGEFLLRLCLDKDEVTAFAAGLKMARHFLPHLSEAADELWTKIGGFLPKELLEEGEGLSRSTTVSLPVSALDPVILQTAIDAIRNKQTLSITYESPYQNNEPKKRLIYPWGVYFQSHAWYLWAGSPDHEQGATWRISRIKQADNAKEPYKPAPSGQTVQDYAATAWFARPGELKYDIKLHIFMPLASIVAETIWHPTQKIEPQPDGSIIYKAKVPDLEEVARWAMSCAPHIEVLGPEGLRKRIVELGKDIADHNL